MTNKKEPGGHSESHSVNFTMRDPAVQENPQRFWRENSHTGKPQITLELQQNNETHSVNEDAFLKLPFNA